MAGKKLYGKDYFARELAKKHGFSIEKANDVVQTLCKDIVGVVMDGGLVKLGDLGTLRLKERAARTGTDPRTGAVIDIPKSYSIKANISSTLREALRRRDDGC